MRLNNVRYVLAATILASMMSGCIVHVGGGGGGLKVERVFGDIDVDESSHVKTLVRLMEVSISMTTVLQRMLKPLMAALT